MFTFVSPGARLRRAALPACSRAHLRHRCASSCRLFGRLACAKGEIAVSVPQQLGAFRRAVAETMTARASSFPGKDHRTSPVAAPS